MQEYKIRSNHCILSLFRISDIMGGRSKLAK